MKRLKRSPKRKETRWSDQSLLSLLLRDRRARIEHSSISLILMRNARSKLSTRMPTPPLWTKKLASSKKLTKVCLEWISFVTLLVSLRTSFGRTVTSPFPNVTSTKLFP